MKIRYKFTVRNHSRTGIRSSILGVISLLLTGSMVAAAYLEYGQAGKQVAVLGFLALLLSLTGLYHGFRGLGEEDTYKGFPYAGCILNGLVLLSFAGIYLLGTGG